MGSRKMDSYAVYTLFEELKRKITEFDRRTCHNTNKQTDSTANSDGIISLVANLKVHQPAAVFTATNKKLGTDFGVFD